jgi:hypothetical protein
MHYLMQSLTLKNCRLEGPGHAPTRCVKRNARTRCAQMCNAMTDGDAPKRRYKCVIFDGFLHYVSALSVMSIA